MTDKTPRSLIITAIVFFALGFFGGGVTMGHQKYDTHLYNCQTKHNVYKCSMQPDIGHPTP